MRTLLPSGAAVLACALVAVAGAGCGSEREAPPRLSQAVAERLAARSESVARHLDAGDGCRARSEAEALHAEAIDAVNRRRVPPRFQEELLGSVTALVESIECVQPAPAADPDEDAADDDEDDEDRDKGKERKGKGKKGGKNGKGKG